ncbi:EutN/CcmL family microcompartment protein [Planctomyces sp. SH-PL62]|uniref:EutN/CcmL family microcompartment protein n=1 Tax=Planctomyces sp. SH-PL62 TaxID=1636152 RepID=UPI00078E0E25|nr:EutN/CcmL family microcompartment protein [Planctomyces sp. SH-PL62]AMV38033.1 Ethanolamine utilization protein EutN/carboxysome [Planctomyces sp. SH-PL62]
MRIAEVVGRVTLSRAHPRLRGARFPIVLPMTLAALRDGDSSRGDDVVAYDRLGVGLGDLIGLSEGGEAANPFGKEKAPIDAYCACLLDAISF